MKNKFILLATLALTLASASCSKKGGGEGEPEPEKTFISIEGHRFSTMTEETYESTRFFSTSLNRSFKTSDVTTDNAAKIDLCFGVISQGLYGFMSPDDKQYGIKNAGATKTEYMLDWKAEKISEAEFAAISKSEDFNKFTFKANQEAISYSSKVPFFCFFRNAAGKMGVIKITKISPVGMDPCVVADIKVQK